MRVSDSAINDVLIKEDIEGLIEIGAPIDEYESEAAQIAAALKRAASLIMGLQ